MHAKIKISIWISDRYLDLYKETCYIIMQRIKRRYEMNTGVSYSMFYEILLNLREYFHSYGRIDDSNAKLDEIVKLISVNYELASKGKKFSLQYIRRRALELTGNENNIADGLIQVFEEEAQEKIFFNDDRTNIFGVNPTLNLQSNENEFAEKLISEIEKIDFIHLLEQHKYSDFDIINECFGHFVRENFRNNKEDAQYMTPYEISEPILDVMFADMTQEGYFSDEVLKNFTIMDPTCGVGTLLIESANHFTRYIEKNILGGTKTEEYINRFRQRGMVGQDKVERMVRLSKINALLLGCNISNINIGNSITGQSIINSYLGRVNMIFTNPPFGAEYEISHLNIDEFPLLKQMEITANNISSELLMLDKCIALLKENGYLAIVLPDSVFASKGVNALYRDVLLKSISIKGVYELPSVTFAQAGTRTNTCVLYLRKRKPSSDSQMFMAICEDLGYVVKEKMGVPVKISRGKNDMLEISSVLSKKEYREKIIMELPSVTQVSMDELTENIIKPSFYAAERFRTVENMSKFNTEGYEIKRLSDIAVFVTASRKSYMVSNNIKHISLLHINNNCTINFNEVEKFEPISKGRSCVAGDLLFSKLNPRIPRMAVVPEKSYNLVCSNEFEIIKPIGEIDAYTLCFLLQTSNVKVQIESMTSGTSSSHSRIKREQLGEILIPVPVGQRQITEMKKMGEKLKKAIEKIYLGENLIFEQQALLEKIS